MTATCLPPERSLRCVPCVQRWRCRRWSRRERRGSVRCRYTPSSFFFRYLLGFLLQLEVPCALKIFTHCLRREEDLRCWDGSHSCYRLRCPRSKTSQHAIGISRLATDVRACAAHGETCIRSCGIPLHISDADEMQNSRIQLLPRCLASLQQYDVSRGLRRTTQNNRTGIRGWQRVYQRHSHGYATLSLAVLLLQSPWARFLLCKELCCRRSAQKHNDRGETHAPS